MSIQLVSQEEGEEAWLLGQEEGRGALEPENSQTSLASLSPRLKCVLLCILALGCAMVFARARAASVEQPSRFRQSILAKYEKGLEAKDSAQHDHSDFNVGPASLVWQCMSGSVPTACQTSFASTFLALLVAASICLVLGAIQFFLRRQSAELAMARDDLKRIMQQPLIFDAHELKSSVPDLESKGRMKKAWDVSARRENLQVLDELALIMNRYPSVHFQLVGGSLGTGEISQRTESAFYEDFHSHFPSERMDWLQPYAQARALSLKRHLGQRGISYHRLHVSVRVQESNALVVEAFL